MHTYIHAQAHTYIHTRTQTHAHTKVCAHTYAHTHTHTHTYTNACTSTQAQTHVYSSGTDKIETGRGKEHWVISGGSCVLKLYWSFSYFRRPHTSPTSGRCTQRVTPPPSSLSSQLFVSSLCAGEIELCSVTVLLKIGIHVGIHNIYFGKYRYWYS